ncbi:MAG: hypothetical protein V4692_09880 [Bdellovibrionota bacterium]
MFSVHVRADEVLPEWAEIGSGWKARAVLPDRVLLSYKSDRAFIFVETTPVDVNPADLTSFFRTDFKKDAIDLRRNAVNFYAKSEPIFDTSVRKEDGLETATIVTHFNTGTHDTHLAEKYWVVGDKNKSTLWHIVFVETSASIVPANSHENAIDLLQKKILDRTTEARVQGLKRSLVELVLLSVGEAGAAEVVRSRAAAAPSTVASSSRPTAACEAAGFDREHLRNGRPDFDVNFGSLGPACRANLEKLVNSTREAITVAIRELGNFKDVPDLQECRHLKPTAQNTKGKSISVLLNDYNVWRSCVQDRQVRNAGANALAAGRNLATNRVFADEVKQRVVDELRLAFSETLHLTAKGLIYTLIPHSRTAAFGSLVENAGRELSNIGCLKQSVQSEVLCKYAANVATITTAAVCTAVTKGKCAATLAAKFKSFSDDALSKFKSSKPARASELAADARRVLKAERLSASRADDLATRGIASVRHGFDCEKINKHWAGSFPAGSKNCTAITAKKDIEGEFCSCSTIEKRQGFNFLGYCPRKATSFASVADYKDRNTLPPSNMLDMCVRVTIPKGKECYSGSTARASGDVISGRGGWVQILCFDGISPRRQHEVNAGTLRDEGFTNARPDLRVKPTQWSPFSDFGPYQKIIQRAQEVCTGTCDIASYRELMTSYNQASVALRQIFARNPAQLQRLERERRVFEEYFKELGTGVRNPLPPVR